MSRWCAAFLAASLAWPTGAAAIERDYGPLHLELRAHLRSLLTFTRQTRLDDLFPGVDPNGEPLPSSSQRSDAGLWLNRARLELGARLGDRWSAEIAYDNELLSGSGLRSLDFELGREIGEETWLDADRTISSRRDLEWRHALYRAWLRYEGRSLEVTLGRQRIALGRGRLWNPSDLFNPIPPLAIEGDQRVGQDSLLVRARAWSQLWVALIWSPQDDPDEHRAAGRLEWSGAALDAALMVARIERDWVVSADLARNLRGAAVRAEVTYTNPRREDRFWQAVASIDYTFGIGTGLYVLAEHFFNENLVSRLRPEALAGRDLRVSLAELARVVTPRLSRLVTNVRNQTGLQVGYDVTPLLRADLLWLHDWNGPSEAIVPSLTWTPLGNLEVSVGAQLFLGDGDETEYGQAANLVFARLDIYF